MISGDAANAVNLPFEELASQCTENYRLPSPFRSEITPLYEESLLTLDTSSFARLLSGLESDNDIVGDNVESHLLYPPIIAPTDPSDLDREGKKEILRQLKEEATKIELGLPSDRTSHHLSRLTCSASQNSQSHKLFVSVVFLCICYDSSKLRTPGSHVDTLCIVYRRN